MDFNEAHLKYTIKVTSYVSLCLCVIGVLGNIIAMRIMAKKTFRQISSSVFIFWLAFVDTIVLVYLTLDDLAVQLPGYSGDDVINGSGVEWRCRTSTFIYHMNRVSSSWLVVALAVELAITYERPERALAVRTRARALHVTMTIILLSIAASFPLLVITTSVDGRCSSKYVVFHRIYSNLVLSIGIDVLVPTTIIVIMLLKSVYVYLKKDKIIDHKINDILENIDIFAIQSMTKFSQNSHTTQTKRAKKTLSLGCVLALSAILILTLSPHAYFEGILVYGGLRSPDKLDVNDPGIGTSGWKSAAAIARCLLSANYSLKFYALTLMSHRVRTATISLSTCGLLKRTMGNRELGVWISDEYDTSRKAPVYTMSAERAANYDSGLIRR